MLKSLADHRYRVEVEVWIRNYQCSSANQPPFTLPWPPEDSETPMILADHLPSICLAKGPL